MKMKIEVVVHEPGGKRALEVAGYFSDDVAPDEAQKELLRTLCHAAGDAIRDVLIRHGWPINAEKRVDHDGPVH